MPFPRFEKAVNTTLCYAPKEKAEYRKLKSRQVRQLITIHSIVNNINKIVKVRNQSTQKTLKTHSYWLTKNTEIFY